MSFKLPKKVTGQIYLDLLITLAILSILTPALISLVLASLSLISYTKARVTAKHLAQEKIELIRNLPYSQVGIIGGIPAGPLPQTENIFRNGLNYQVTTSVIFIDDPFDQTAPQDLLPTDYKKARVEVTWEGLAASTRNPVILVTNIVPKGIETTEGGGTLSILVFNALGEPVSQAQATIFNDDVDPAINLTLETSDDGRIILPGAPACTDCYQISITKENYSSERTYSTEEITNPYKPHLTIIEGALSEISFAIDKLSKIRTYSLWDRAHNFAPLANQSFTLRGAKALGTDVNDELVYKFEQEFTTGSSGQLLIEDLEWDNYFFILPEATGWDLSGSNPLLPIALLPDTTLDFKFSLTSATTNNLLAIFMDSSRSPVASVAAKLTRQPDFEATASSGLAEDPDFGQIFFKNLSAEEYLLEATVSEFLDYQNTVNVIGKTIEEIILEAE